MQSFHAILLYSSFVTRYFQAFKGCLACFRSRRSNPTVDFGEFAFKLELRIGIQESKKWITVLAGLNLVFDQGYLEDHYYTISLPQRDRHLKSSMPIDPIRNVK